MRPQNSRRLRTNNSARRALGRARRRTGPASCCGLVPARDRLSTGVREGARAPGGNLRESGRRADARLQLDAARFGFKELLRKQLLAFADHAAAFYDGSGNDRRRALGLARVNATNRPTRRAVGQVHAIVAKGRAGRSDLTAVDEYLGGDG